MALVVVKDLVEELTEENKRLFNELLLAKQCLNKYNEFKTFIDLISHKFKYDLDINELQKYFELNASVETSVEQLSDVKCEITSGLQKNGVHIIDDDNEDSSGRNEEAIGLNEDFDWNRTIDLSAEGFVDSIPVVEGNGPKLWSDLPLSSTSKTITSFPKPIVTKILSQNSLLSKKSHNSEKFKCYARKCQKYFPTIASLKQHIRSCHSEKRFVCHHPGCTYKTSRNWNLKKHLTVHTTEKPESVHYKCSYMRCERSYRRLEDLKKHEYVVHKSSLNTTANKASAVTSAKRLLKCPFPGCLYTSVHPSAISVHKRLHSDDRPFACHYADCDKRFKLKKYLIQHWRTHRN